MHDPTRLTAERLRELLHYDPDTGVFTWRVYRGGTARAGTRAGSVRSDGYRIITINKVGWRAHRLAWLYMTGEHPINEVDHRNGNPDDISWTNLRQASSGQNKQNQRRAHADNSTGLLGVTFSISDGKFRAQIGHRYKNRCLGRYDTAEEAHAAYVAAKRRIHTHGTI